MNDDFLKSRLQRVARRFQWVGLWRRLAVCWAVAALVAVGVVWVQRATGNTWTLALPVLLVLALGGAKPLRFAVNLDANESRTAPLASD